MVGRASALVEQVADKSKDTEAKGSDSTDDSSRVRFRESGMVTLVFHGVVGNESRLSGDGVGLDGDSAAGLQGAILEVCRCSLE